jgi:hypothetical protein
MARPIHPIKMTTGSGGGAAGRPLADPFFAVPGFLPVPGLGFFFLGAERVWVLPGLLAAGFRAGEAGFRAGDLFATGRADVMSIASWAA